MKNKKKVIIVVIVLCVLLVAAVIGFIIIKKNKTKNQDDANRVLTLERFKEVMSNNGLQVVQLNEDNENAANVLYQADDNELNIIYSVNVYKNEETAKSFWDSFMEYTYAEYNEEDDDKKEIFREDKEHSNKLEFHTNRGINIEYRLNDVSISVVIPEYLEKNDMKKVKGILYDLGYEIKSEL